jgi:hypothetical protein
MYSVVRDALWVAAFGLILGLSYLSAQESAQAAQQASSRPATVPDKAEILQLQEDLIDREKLILVLQEQILILRKQILDQQKSVSESDIVKSAGGADGQGWDYKARKLKPIPAKTPDKTKP